MKPAERFVPPPRRQVAGILDGADGERLGMRASSKQAASDGVFLQKLLHLRDEGVGLIPEYAVARIGDD